MKEIVATAYVDEHFKTSFRKGAFACSGEFVIQHGYVVQFTGALENREELIKSLNEETLYDDASLVISGFLKWGTELFERLEGRFSFMLYAIKSEKLYLVRDPFGIEALFYFYDAKHFVCSNRLQRLLDLSFVPKRLDFSSLSCYFSYGFILQPNTIYKGCFKLYAGEYLCYDLRTKCIEQKRYWEMGSFFDIPKQTGSEEEILEEVARLLQKAIRKRLAGKEKIALLLSGGYDSSVVAALLKEQDIGRVQSFTVGFGQEGIDEAPYAKEVATYLGLKHHTYYFQESEVVQGLEGFYDIFEEPFYDEGALAMAWVASWIKREGVTSLFCGDGGDEVFATADHLEWFQSILALPQALRRGLASSILWSDPARIGFLREHFDLQKRQEKLVEYLMADDIPSMLQTKMRLFSKPEMRRLLKNHNRSFPNRFDTLFFAPYAEDVDRLTGAYLQTFMSDGEIVKSSSIASYYGFLLKEPYLDKALLSFMVSVPQKIKIKGGVRKYLLKKIAHRKISKALLDRPKHGFAIPSSKWMRGVLKEMLIDILSPRRLKEDAILDSDYVLFLRDAFLKGKEAYKYRLWSIFLYQLWYEKKMR